jgi:DnaJ-like protein
MMGEAIALRVAIDLMRIPSRVRVMRSQPLQGGVLVLLRIAAGDEEAEREAIELTGRSRDVVRQAAEFFIEQILLCPSADSYRVLGADPQATSSELRRNMALLLRWLHPDMDRQGQRSVFASRVTLAWNDLKTAERRTSYDEAKRASPASKSTFRKNGEAFRSRKRAIGKRFPASSRPAVSRHLSAPRQRGAFDMYSDDKMNLMYGGEKMSLLRRAWLFLLGGATR